MGDEWRSPTLRQQMLQKIEAAFQQSPTPVGKSPLEMEQQLFSKAKNKEEYMDFVSKLVNHISNMAQKGAGILGVQNANKGQVTMVQMSGNQGNMNMMNSGMAMMHQQGMMNPNTGANQNVGQGATMMQQQMGNQGPNQMMGGQAFVQQNQMQNVAMQNQNMGSGLQMHGQQGMISQQMQNHPIQGMVQLQNQQMQSQPGQGQNQQMQGMQMQDHMRNVSMGNMQGIQMNNQVLSNNMANPTMTAGVTTLRMQNMGSAQMTNQQIGLQNSQMNESQLRGNVQHMTGSGQQIHMSQMSNQMPGMQNMMNASQQQGQVNRTLGPGAMGNRMVGTTNMPGQMPKTQVHHRMHRPPSMENMTMINSYNAGNMMTRAGTPQYTPNAPQSIGQTPSPGPPNQIPTYVGSPGQPSRMNSPATGMTSMANIRGFPGGPGVPSPQNSLNTPVSVATPSPGPRSVDDQACQDKIKELRKYIDLLQRMIAKAGNDDVEKTSKMKKLLEILTNSNQRVSMDVLLKCETALKRMEKQQNDAGVFTNTPQPTIPTIKDQQVSPYQQLMDSLLNLAKAPSSCHTLLRTFRPAVDALAGHSFSISAQTEEDESISKVERRESEIPPLLKRELRTLDSRFKISVSQKGGGITRVTCVLNDIKLPKVPPLKISVRNDYPCEPPAIEELTKDYHSTPFLLAVARALKSRLLHMPKNHSVIELLYLWEMCVRQASNPNPCAKYGSKSTPSSVSILALGL